MSIKHLSTAKNQWINRNKRKIKILYISISLILSFIIEAFSPPPRPGTPYALIIIIMWIILLAAIPLLAVCIIKFWEWLND